MRCVDILASFELEINKIDATIEKPMTDDSLYWINQAVIKFVKDRFNGNAPERTSYEQNEKRTRDLVHLWRQCTLHINKDLLEEGEIYSPSDPEFNAQDGDTFTSWNETYEGEIENEEFIRKYEVWRRSDTDPKDNRVLFIGFSSKQPLYDEYECLYPKNMMFVLNEDVVISDTNGNNETDASVFECTADSFMYRVRNKLTDFHYRFHTARPLRIRTSRGFRLLTDKKYDIKSYTLGFLKIPDEITNEDPYKNYEDFEDNIWLEIIKMAAQMYIENQSDPRYRTITNEVLTQE
jgi:hypothetical protein